MFYPPLFGQQQPGTQGVGPAPNAPLFGQSAPQSNLAWFGQTAMQPQSMDFLAALQSMFQPQMQPMMPQQPMAPMGGQFMPQPMPQVPNAMAYQPQTVAPQQTVPFTNLQAMMPPPPPPPAPPPTETPAAPAETPTSIYDGFGTN